MKGIAPGEAMAKCLAHAQHQEAAEGLPTGLLGIGNRQRTAICTIRYLEPSTQRHFAAASTSSHS